MSDKPQKSPTELHWLVRPKTIKWLWVGGLLSLAIVTLLSLFVPHHVTFGIEATPAFYSWYGFITCVTLVIFAKFVLGKLLSRKDTYYDE